MDTSVTVAGITLEHPLMNAAGMAKVVEDVERLARSASSAIVIGSYTTDARTGNSGTTYATESHNRSFSLNSRGLPNPGMDYLEKYLPKMVSIAHEANKPLFVSVAGVAPAEYELLVECAFSGGADLVEINLGCPNVWNEKLQHKIPSFSPITISEIIHFIQRAAHKSPKKPICMKLSPFSDPALLKIIARAISNCPYALCVTSMNTFPNAFAFEKNSLETPLLSSRDGYGGLGGSAIKAIGLGQIKQLRDSFEPYMSLIGVGGITSGWDMMEYLSVGANAVQVATAYCNRGEQIFEEILTEYLDLLSRMEKKE